MKYPGGVAIYYYLDYAGFKHGSVYLYKILMMSKEFSNGKVDVCGIAEFDGHLMSKEWL